MLFERHAPSHLKLTVRNNTDRNYLAVQVNVFISGIRSLDHDDRRRTPLPAEPEPPMRTRNGLHYPFELFGRNGVAKSWGPYVPQVPYIPEQPGDQQSISMARTLPSVYFRCVGSRRLEVAHQSPSRVRSGVNVSFAVAAGKLPGDVAGHAYAAGAQVGDEAGGQRIRSCRRHRDQLPGPPR